MLLSEPLTGDECHFGCSSH